MFSPLCRKNDVYEKWCVGQMIVGQMTYCPIGQITIQTKICILNFLKSCYTFFTDFNTVLRISKNFETFLRISMSIRTNFYFLAETNVSMLFFQQIQILDIWIQIVDVILHVWTQSWIGILNLYEHKRCDDKSYVLKWIIDPDMNFKS